jgi:hypothetical protein
MFKLTQDAIELTKLNNQLVNFVLTWDASYTIPDGQDVAYIVKLHVSVSMNIVWDFCPCLT